MVLTLDFPPRGMPAPQAAHYIGVSQSMLLTLGIPRKQLGGKFIYDRLDLDAFVDSLPIDGQQKEPGCGADEAFGVR